MQLLQSKKEENYNKFCDELLRERAAVLSRAGHALEDAIAELEKIDKKIQKKNKELKLLPPYKPDYANQRQIVIAEINFYIDQFNAACTQAHLKYYYLIVTREALGLRRHNMIHETYRIPIKKKKIQVP
jgi:L-lactate utilization protein LutB